MEVLPNAATVFHNEYVCVCVFVWVWEEGIVGEA